MNKNLALAALAAAVVGLLVGNSLGARNGAKAGEIAGCQKAADVFTPAEIQLKCERLDGALVVTSPALRVKAFNLDTKKAIE